MRVLFMAHAWVPYHCGGAEVMAHQMMRRLVERGHRVDVLLSAVDPLVTADYKHDGVRVYQRRGKADPTRWFHAEQPPDVVISHLENVNRATLLARMYGVPVVHVQHNHIAQTTAQLERYRPDMVVFNTQWMREFYEGWAAEKGTTLPPHVVIPPPTDPSDYTTNPGDMVTLVNLYAEKGAHLFYKLAQLRPDLKFLGVVGGYGHQVIREDLPNVEIVPHIPSERMRDEVYSRTRLLLVPSSYESYGRVAAEAMCSGIPVIAHPTPGLLECVGKGGLFADREYPEEWVAHLARLDKPREYAKASRAASTRAAKFTPDKDLDRFADALEVVGGARARNLR